MSNLNNKKLTEKFADDVRAIVANYDKNGSDILPDVLVSLVKKYEEDTGYAPVDPDTVYKPAVQELFDWMGYPSPWITDEAQ